MIRSQTARRWGFHEQFTPPQHVITNLTALCVNVLQPIRDYLGKPLRVTSGYRCPRLNAAVNGRYDLINKDGTTKVRQTSQHVQGEAADLEFWLDGVERNDMLVEAIRVLRSRGLMFDQLIKEYGTLERPEWIHVSYRKDRLRGQVLRAYYVGKKTTYSPTQL